MRVDETGQHGPTHDPELEIGGRRLPRRPDPGDAVAVQHDGGVVQRAELRIVGGEFADPVQDDRGGHASTSLRGAEKRRRECDSVSGEILACWNMEDVPH
jgi:hypothetical protein